MQNDGLHQGWYFFGSHEAMNRTLAGIALSLLVGAGAQAQPAAAPNTQVSFIKPEKFIDASDQGLGMGSSPRVLNELKGFLETLGAQQLPPGQQLVIEVRNIDLAGRFEPLPGRPSEWVRIQRDSDWPRIQLHYRLSAQGQLLREANANVSDMSYLQKARSSYSSQPLVYEKRMLADWFKTTFAPPQARTQ